MPFLHLPILLPDLPQTKPINPPCCRSLVVDRQRRTSHIQPRRRLQHQNPPRDHASRNRSVRSLQTSERKQVTLRCQFQGVLQSIGDEFFCDRKHIPPTNPPVHDSANDNSGQTLAKPEHYCVDMCNASLLGLALARCFNTTCLCLEIFCYEIYFTNFWYEMFKC